MLTPRVWRTLGRPDIGIRLRQRQSIVMRWAGVNLEPVRLSAGLTEVRSSPGGMSDEISGKLSSRIASRITGVVAPPIFLLPQHL
jgi:hypothetical protein